MQIPRSGLYLAAAAALAVSTGAVAKHDASVKNELSEEIKVYWIAAGCAGLSDGRTLVCDSKNVKPGATGSYTFKDGTSARKLSFKGAGCGHGAGARWDVSNTTSFTVKGCGIQPVAAASAPSGGSGEAYTFKNTRTESVDLYWRAVGCARVEGGLGFVCKSQTLKPGESTTYTYPAGTSGRTYIWTSVSCPSPGITAGGISVMSNVKSYFSGPVCLTK